MAELVLVPRMERSPVIDQEQEYSPLMCPECSNGLAPEKRSKAVCPSSKSNKQVKCINLTRPSAKHTPDP